MMPTILPSKTSLISNATVKRVFDGKHGLWHNGKQTMQQNAIHPHNHEPPHHGPTQAWDAPCIDWYAAYAPIDLHVPMAQMETSASWSVHNTITPNAIRKMRTANTIMANDLNAGLRDTTHDPEE